MQPAEVRCEPDFAHRRLNVHDDLRARLEFDRQHVAAAGTVEVIILGLKRVLQRFERFVCRSKKSRLFVMIKKTVFLGAIAAILSLTLAGCGLKGDLYMPGDEPDAVQRGF